MIKLHLGCGWRNFGKDWVHIDGGDYDHLNDYDITRLNFDNNTVDLIYASHVLEYFDRKEAELVLKEWYRVLKPNGILRVAVPDFESMVNLYCYKAYSLEEFLGPLYGKMEMGDKTIYHKTTYDFNSLSDLLEQCGFLNVETYDWRETEHASFDDHSQAYKPHMDKESGTLISLNVEATK
jgi:predicted SAM-dependent methyltransferase